MAGQEGHIVKGYIGRGIHGSTVEMLGARIVDGVLAPGEVLDLPQIGRELDVSLTALREAIKVLMAKGLLDARQKRGTFVRPREEWNFLDSDVIRWRHQSGDVAGVQRDLAEVRSAIEPAAADLAARRRTDEDVVALKEALDAMQESRDGAAHDSAAADQRFHQALLRASHNEFLAQMGIFVKPALLIREVLVHGHDVTDPVPSHKRVVDAVIAQEPAAAAAAALALLEDSVADVEKVLTQEHDE